MRKKKEEVKVTPKIRHFLADGREVESIEGIEIPTTGSTAVVYQIFAEMIKNHPELYQKVEENIMA